MSGPDDGSYGTSETSVVTYECREHGKRENRTGPATQQNWPHCEVCGNPMTRA